MIGIIKAVDHLIGSSDGSCLLPLYIKGPDGIVIAKTLDVSRELS